jgi:hypothetical protein
MAARRAQVTGGRSRSIPSAGFTRAPALSSPPISHSSTTPSHKPPTRSPCAPHAASTADVTVHELTDGEFVTVLLDRVQPVDFLRFPAPPCFSRGSWRLRWHSLGRQQAAMVAVPVSRPCPAGARAHADSGVEQALHMKLISDNEGRYTLTISDGQTVAF